MPACLGSGNSPLPGCRWLPSCELALWPPLIRTLNPFMTSYLPKALFPDTVTLRIRFQHMNLGVRDTNIQSINGVRLSSLLQSELVLWLALTNRTQQKWLSGTSKFRPEEGWHFTSCTFELEPSCEKSRLHCEREATWSDCGG